MYNVSGTDTKYTVFLVCNSAMTLTVKCLVTDGRQNVPAKFTDDTNLFVTLVYFRLH
jgi:hypothetical protein